jgi:glucosamine--fructose-6-phosphate aminotransferase (isomerizing)
LRKTVERDTIAEVEANMCGITGYIGCEQASPRLLAMLQRLEYRGYDSAGVAVLDEGAIAVRKMKGHLDVLMAACDANPLHGSVGIGHTRWATHGEPSDLNAHPHTDVSGRIAIVHNGIIENYARLKAFLSNKGVVFHSQTDTEVVAHLLNYFYSQTPPDNDPLPRLLHATLLTLAKLEGSYSLGILCADVPDRVIGARRRSPLVVGLADDATYIASDVPALLPYTRRVQYLRDGEVAVLSRSGATLLNCSGERVEREVSTVQWDAQAAEKNGYAHFMRKEINEQPDAITATLSSRVTKDAQGKRIINLDELNLDAALAGATQAVVVGCGTAYHACVVAKYAFERFARLPTEVDIASEYRYREPIISSDALFIVVSQSGETADTLAAARLARDKGKRVLAITNVVGSTLARGADMALYTWAGPEIAVASTKAFTTQLVCIYLLALRMAQLRGTMDAVSIDKALAALEAVPEQARSILAHEGTVQRFASRQFNKKKVFFIGRQFDYATALEAALKLKEISYTHSEAFAAGELKHGAIALVDKTTLAVALATQPALYDKMASNISEVTTRGADALVITQAGSEDRFAALDATVVTIPATQDAITPLLAIIPLQLFAYYCAIQKGNDPDKPRNLAKSVTVE